MIVEGDIYRSLKSDRLDVRGLVFGWAGNNLCVCPDCTVLVCGCFECMPARMEGG